MENVYIFGSQGQDGQLLNELLKANDIDFNLILFTKNSVLINNFEDIKEIQIENNYSYITLVNSLFIKFPPKIIFYFAAVHFSATEFRNQISDNDLNNMSFVNYFLPLHIFNYCNINEIAAKILFTSSALVFSNSEESPQSEKTNRKPSCIYGKQKVLIEEYLIKINKKFNYDTYTAILYNHESVYRKERFFTKKLISFCSNYRSNTSKSKLELFNKNLSIDMGYAPEYVNAMYKLITKGKPMVHIFSQLKN